MKKQLLGFIILFALTLNGCVNPYADFYQGATDAVSRSTYIARTGPIEIYASDNFERDVEQLTRRGFSFLGSSSFNGATDSVTKQQLLAQAEKVGAHVVLVSSRNTGTITGALPITVPNTTTSQTSGSATVYGSGGSATVYGRATTTTYGQHTMLMPYTIQRSDFTAVYLIRQRFALGAYWRPIDEQTMRRLQTNQAVQVTLVVEDSPAFRADILPNDIITQVDGTPVGGSEALKNYLASKAGSKVSFVIDREGKRVEKVVALNAL
jgi:hypothetical protein